MDTHILDYVIQHELRGAGINDLARKIKPITLEQAKDDYEKLRNTDCSKIKQSQMYGNMAMDYFFLAHRLKTKSKKGIDFPEFWRKKLYLSIPSYKRLYEYGKKHNKIPLVSAYDVFRLYFSSINAFKPIIARSLYCKYMPKTILDISAGWGGRCLGAMSLDINYIGFDTNTSLKKAYAGMLKTYPTKSDVEIIFKDSSKVDYSKYDYDFVFTSPPYFMKTKPTEEYEHMPKYETREEFNEKFLFPVVENSYKHLKKGGHYALNIPIDMYEDVKKVLGKADKKYPLFIKPRFSGQKPTYKEFIYVWNK